MSKIAERDLLRLSMILENQGETTRNKYICKLTECIIFDSEQKALSSLEICEEIRNRFQLEFDVLEIENAIHSKGKGRISLVDKEYQLNAKVNDQLSTQVSAENKLKRFVIAYAEQESNVDAEVLLGLIQKYLYYCFNSNAKNFNSIIGTKIKACIDEDVINEFKPKPEEIDYINGFLLWQNSDKDKLLYSIVSSCYEYCLITTNKNPVISKSIFKGKKFFLDTNIIFRIAGINQDERMFVIKTFVDKCREVGVSLCYTSSVLNEIYRVIDKQIDYIKSMARGHVPIDPNTVSRLSYNFDTNDFYSLFCDWCKEPQNKYYDYISFRNYLLKRINGAICEFDYIDSSNFKNENNIRSSAMFENLKAFKNSRRSYRKTTDESIKTDVNQVLFLESLRPKSAKSLWEMNEYIVSADQLLIAWSDETFDGVPMVVIPSLWLSIILKVSGRASQDDYKSFCMFMTLRHHHTDEDDVNINPVELLSRLSEKTIDKQIKELVINEILTNRSEYSFDDVDSYDASIDHAFDKILSEEKNLHKEELLKAVEAEKEATKEVTEKYKKELESKKSLEEHAEIFSRKKAQKKVDWFAQHENIPLIVEGGLFIILILFFVLSYIVKLEPLVELITRSNEEDIFSLKNFSAFTWIFGIFTVTLPLYFHKIWKYLSSESRRIKLCSKYYKDYLKTLND